jgi:hypothetical protein
MQLSCYVRRITTLDYISDNQRIGILEFRFIPYYHNGGYAEIPFPTDTGLIARNASAKIQADADYKYNLLSW